MFDNFEASVEGVPVPEPAWRGERSRRLLQFLATRPQCRATSDELMEALWSHLPLEQARGSLHVTVNRLRRALGSVTPDGSGEQLLIATATGYQLTAGTWVDVQALHQLVPEVRSLEAQNSADALKRLDEVPWVRTPELNVDQPYSDWATAVRERVRRDFVSLQLLRADLLQNCGRSGQALEALLRVLESEPVLESVARQAMLVAYGLGNQVLALSIFDRCRHALLDELGVTPLPETLAVHARILAQQAAAAGEAPAGPRHERNPGPAPLTGPALPLGRVTYLCSQIQGLDRLQGQPADLVEQVLKRYMMQVVDVVTVSGGTLCQDISAGWTLTAVFSQPAAAVAAAVSLGQQMNAEDWSGNLALLARLSVHSGEADSDGAADHDQLLDRCVHLGAIAHGGQILLSSGAASLLWDRLPAELSLRDLGPHRLRDLAAVEHVFQLVHPALPIDFPPLVSLDARPGNLPVQLTSFVGRRRELEKVKRLLRSSRLVTLTGAGGSGKTRLSLQAAAAVAPESFADGVWFVDLAPLTDPTLVAVAVMEALGLQDQAQRPPMSTLSAHLKTRQALLVLDNCEHLVAACATLAQTLLQACPRLSILATSREPLGVQGEVVLALPGLPVPDADAPSDLESLQHFDAVRLFLHRVRAANPTLTLRDLSPVHVVRICRRLDGMPLAIELAAARARALTVEQIAVRLDDRFRLLTAGSRTALPRQQTLWATIDWSHELLTEPERVLLRRLSVFAGGCTLEMGEAVCTGDGLAAGEILDLLSRLVDRSLVLADHQGAAVRYSLLETIRHYAAQKLQQSGEQAVLAGRHLASYARLVGEGEMNALLPDQKAWFDSLQAELDNIRAALAWSRAGGSASDGLTLASSLYWFWDVRGHMREGRKVLAAILSQRDAPSTGTVRAHALVGYASLAFFQADYAEAIRVGTQGLALAKELDDPLHVTAGLTFLGWATLRSGDTNRARPFFEEALETAVMPALAYSARQGLGHVYSELGDYERAEALMEEALASARLIGNPRWVAVGLAHAGAVALLRGRHGRAHSLLVDALAQFDQLDDLGGLILPLAALARVQQALGHLEPAAQIFGAAGALRERTGTYQVLGNVSAHEAIQAATRAALGEAAFAAAYAAGAAMNRSQVLTYVGALVSPG
jgi:predicted ATPase/DNA-binding SARP family transcriptional activator